ncbi:MAG TPA: DUF1573 domain-containing protein [Puia sp.]|nr:DUF1573 domain-containing protein [Puia sp.]
MRGFVLITFMGFLFASCTGNDQQKPQAKMKIPTDSSQFTSIRWLDSTYRNFGTIPEGKKLEVSFRFLNSGTKPLIIEQVRPSCGCTVAEQPAEPILPGKEGVIKAVFNSEGRTGVNNKSIYVMANTKGHQNNEVRFSVIVDKKKW